MEDTTPSSRTWISGHGGKRRRSSRFTDDMWDTHKSLLCSLYKSKPLREVMDYMADNYKFIPTKRQYGYRFEKWGIRKYGTPDRRGSTQIFPGNERFPVILTEDYLNTAGNGPTPYLTTPAKGLAHGTPSSASATSTASETGASFRDDTDPDDGTSTSDTLVSAIRYPWGPGGDVKKLVADFCSSMSDDSNAFALYMDLYEILSKDPETSILAKNMIAISIARAADEPQNAKRARELLLKYQSTILQYNSLCQYFLFTMLDINLEEQEDNSSSDTVVRRICETVREVLANDDTLFYMFDTCSDINILVPSIFHTALEVYAKRPEYYQLPMFSSKEHITEYVFQLLVASRIQQGGGSVLRDCVTWCAKQLNLKCNKIPDEIASINCDDHHRSWCNSIQLYCTLWHAMLLLVQNDTPPRWYNPCEFATGICPSELLVTVCWMIGPPTSSNDILQHARTTAEAMISRSDSELWHEFFTKFNWMNEHVDQAENDKAFEADTIQHIRTYVSATFKATALPFPADEPNVQPPPSDFEEELGSWVG